MARSKRESVIFLLDVGPRMHPHLEYAARAVGDYVTGKMFHKPTSEVALFLFGASSTHNAVHGEVVAAGGAPDEYLHIVEQHGLAPPNGSYLETLHNIPHGRGHSDFMDALFVALNRLGRDDCATSARRIVLLTNFCTKAHEEPDSENLNSLVLSMQKWGVALEILSLDVPEDDERYDADKAYNLNQLSTICQEVMHEERRYSSAVDLLGAFKAKQYTNQAQYAGPFSIGTKLSIQVKVVSKTMVERLPPAGRETESQEDMPMGTEGGIERAKEYHWVDDPEHTIPAEEALAAYRYGADLVPVSEVNKAYFLFPVERGMKLLGFLPKAQIPRHHYMKNVSCMVADKAREGSCVALAALVRALVQGEQVAVVRFVARANAKPALFVASPVEATATSAGHLLLNQLPFTEDVRQYLFATWDKEAWRPTDGQLEAAHALVANMSLGKGPAEQMQPDATPNPMLHRLFYELGRRAAHQDAPLQEEDPLVKHIFEPQLAAMPGAAGAAEAAAAAFPLGQAAKASRRGKKQISSERPIDDFNELLASGDVDGAVSGLAALIQNLVLGSVGESKFQQAAELVDTLRQACVDQDRPAAFNDMLKAMFHKCKDDPVKVAFWQRLNRREIRPIDDVEAKASQLDSSQADLWFSQHKLAG